MTKTYKNKNTRTFRKNILQKYVNTIYNSNQILHWLDTKIKFVK